MGNTFADLTRPNYDGQRLNSSRAQSCCGDLSLI